MHTKTELLRMSKTQEEHYSNRENALMNIFESILTT